MCVCGVTDTPGTDKDIDKWLERIKENKEEQKKLEERLKEQKIERTYTFKGKDLKSVTESFIQEISAVSLAIGELSGFDMKV